VALLFARTQIESDVLFLKYHYRIFMQSGIQANSSTASLPEQLDEAK